MKRQGPRTSRPVIVPQPERVRRLGSSGFGWIDARLHRDGWLEVMAPTELALYAFLCLVADRQGVSWYRRSRLSATMAVPHDELCFALRRLCELDLVAYRPFRQGAEDGFHQVLSLPAGGPTLSEEAGPVQPLEWL